MFPSIFVCVCPPFVLAEFVYLCRHAACSVICQFHHLFAIVCDGADKIAALTIFPTCAHIHAYNEMTYMLTESVCVYVC